MESNKTNNQQHLEANLLEIIQCQLPLAAQERLGYLLEKNEVDELTEEEQKEFREYADRIEYQGAARARALVKLAQIRNLDPKTSLDEFFP